MTVAQRVEHIRSSRWLARWPARADTIGVAQVAWPVVVSMLGYTAMGVVDTLFVGRLGTAQLAGTALATTASFLLGSFFLGSLRGVKVVSAQATGAEQHELARRVAWQGLWLASGAGLLIAGFGLLHSQVASLMGAGAESRPHLETYFVLRCLAMPLWFALTGVGEAFQGRGDTRTPMRLNLLANAINIALDSVLIFGFGPIPAMGVAGAGWATVAGFGVAGVVGVVVQRLELGRPVAPDRQVIAQVLRVGLPIGVRFLLDVAGWVLLTAVVARVGEVQVAASQVAIRVISVSFLPGYGLSEAATILVGQAVGAGDRDRADRGFFAALQLAVGLMGAWAVVFWLLPEPLVGLFSDDPEVVAIGCGLLGLAAIFQVVDAVAMVGMGALGGTGDTRYVMVVSIIGTWLVLVPLGWWLALSEGLGARGVWIAITAEISVRAVLTVGRYLGGRWQAAVVVRR